MKPLNKDFVWFFRSDELDKLEDVKKDTNCEIEVKLFTPEDKKDIFFTRVSQIKYLK